MQGVRPSLTGGRFSPRRLPHLDGEVVGFGQLQLALQALNLRLELLPLPRQHRDALVGVRLGLRHGLQRRLELRAVLLRRCERRLRREGDHHRREVYCNHPDATSI